jgi:hypothetical protein
MNSRLFGTAAALVAVLVTVTCKEDPTAALSGGATRLLISPNPLFLSEGGETGNFTVQAVNDALRPVRATITATSPNPAVATVVADNTNPDPSGTSQLFTVTSAAAGQVLLVVSAEGLSGSDTINVLPPAWNGTASTLTPAVGQPMVLYSTALLKFGANSNVDFGGGARGVVTNVHAESLTVIVPQAEDPQPAAWLLEGVVAGGVPLDFPTADLFDIVNPYGPNDVCGTGVAVGEGVFYDGFKSGQADNYYTFTVPAGGATVDFLLQWDGAADIDVLMLNSACSGFIGGFGGATGNNPEDFTMVLPAGTHNLQINLYDAHDDVPHLYKMTINFH